MTETKVRKELESLDKLILWLSNPATDPLRRSAHGRLPRCNDPARSGTQPPYDAADVAPSFNAAKRMGDTGLKFMQERGRMQTGMAADIVVFDPERFTDNSTYENGTAPSTGMKAVIVNGQVALRDDKVLPVFASKPIRFEPGARPCFVPISVEAWNAEFSTGMPGYFTGAFPMSGERQ